MRGSPKLRVPKSNDTLRCVIFPIGAILFLCLLYIFQGKFDGTDNVLEQVRRYSSSQGETFLAANKRNDSLAVQLGPGQTVQGFTVSGTYLVPEKSWSGKTINREEKYTFYIMPTISHPPFMIALPDIQNEGVSRDIYDDGMFEAETHWLFEHILNGKDGCRRGVSSSGEPPLVLDVGANLGWFSAFSSAAGCRVIGVEPQPRMLTLINVTLSVNDMNSRLDRYSNEAANKKYPTMRDRVKILNNIVNTDTQQRLKIVYNNGACWACSWVASAGPEEQSTNEQFIIPPIRLDSVIKEDVLLMKIDIEGYEVRGLESAWAALQKYNVKNILVEWTPKRWSSLHTVDKGTQMLEQLYDIGYTIRHYDLRMEYPKEGLETISYKNGMAWEIPRSKLAHLNEYLTTKASYGEANIWFSKER